MSSDIQLKQSSDYYFIALTYHEAAHALISIYHCINVHGIETSIKNQEGSTKYTVYYQKQWDDQELKNLIILSEIKTIYAGLISEKIYYRDICGSSKFPMHLRIGSSSDLKNASNLIRYNNLSEPGKNTLLYKKQLQEEVEQILLENWESIKVIAHALYKKKKLSFDELKFLLTRRTADNNLWKDRFKRIKTIHGEKELSEEVVKSLLDCI